MRMTHLLAACAAAASLGACEGRKTEAPATAPAQRPAAPPPAATPAPVQDARQGTPEITGEFKLVKASSSDSVFVLKDGKISAITNWGWVARNAPGKPIEVISQQELQSYPASGIVYK